MKKALFLTSMMFASALFSQTPIPDDLGGECECFSDNFCEFCDCFFDGDPATEAFDCEFIDVDDELFLDEEILEDDIDYNNAEFEEVGYLGAVEGTYADFDEVYVIDAETPYTNQVELIPTWCDK